MAGRKPHEPNEKDRRTVETMAGHGIPVGDIARVIKLSEPTLRKYYREELETGQTKANSMVAQSLYQKAMGNGQGAVTACIFWLKVRAGWMERSQLEHEHTGNVEITIRDIAAEKAAAKTVTMGEINRTPSEYWKQ